MLSHPRGKEEEEAASSRMHALFNPPCTTGTGFCSPVSDAWSGRRAGTIMLLASVHLEHGLDTTARIGLNVKHDRPQPHC